MYIDSQLLTKNSHYLSQCILNTNIGINKNSRYLSQCILVPDVGFNKNSHYLSQFMLVPDVGIDKNIICLKVYWFPIIVLIKLTLFVPMYIGFQ